MAELHLPEGHLRDLKDFASTVWGQPGALLKQLPGGAEFIDLGRFSTAFEYITSGILQHDKILLRDEYRTALETLETDSQYRRGVCIIGQPGIGKTYFLLYALVHFLGHKQPVAMQLLNGNRFYLLFNENVAVHSITHSAPLYESRFVWALCDSNAMVERPAGIFMTKPERVRIIQTTSPSESRWKEWSKQMGAWRYYMDLWTEEELQNLATLLGINVQEFLALAGKWGPVPRTLLRHLKYPDFEDQYRVGCRKAVQEGIWMAGGMSLPDADGPALFYFIQPKKYDTGEIDRGSCTIYVPTRTICEYLAEGLQGQTTDIKMRFYEALSTVAETRQAAGFVYESWFHSLVYSEKTIGCQWLVQDSDDDIAQLPTVLRGIKHFPPPSQGTLMALTPPYYWRPSRSNFPGINGALVLDTAIYAFQVTICADHSSPMPGLRKLRNSLPANVKNVPWRVVFVGAGEAQIKTVAEHWAGRLRFPRNAHVHVAWSVIDPVQNGVIYNRCDDETDPLEESDVEIMESEGE